MPEQGSRAGARTTCCEAIHENVEKGGVSRRGLLGLTGAAVAAAATPSVLGGLDGASSGSAFGEEAAGTASASARTGISAPDAPAPNADGNYNIILITTDQEHYYERFPQGTQFLARELLAEIGTTFEKHYTCTNVSTSSRAVIYTGTHVTENLMRDNVEFPWQPPLDENMTTIGDRMREAGYYTAFKGKFHLGKGGAFSTVDGDTPIQMDQLEGYGFSDWNAIGEIAGAPLHGYHYDDYIEGEATQWLREKGAALNDSGQSFFLAVNFVNPHDIMYFDATEEGDDSQAASALTAVNRAPKNAIYASSYPDAGLPASIDDAVDAEGRVPAHAEYEKMWEQSVGTIEGTTEQWERFRDFYLNCIQDNDG